MNNQAHILQQLQQQVAALQGSPSKIGEPAIDMGLGVLNQAFPNRTFPLAAVHEFVYNAREEAAASTGFVAGLLAPLLRKGGAALWIGDTESRFPPALQSFGIAPHRVIYVQLRKEKEILWAMEEALKCEGLAAVIGELPQLAFTASRRLQLAVEKTRVTGFVLRQENQKQQVTACVTRWAIQPLPSQAPAGMPGLGYPRWRVQLLKVRNGRPGSWDLEYRGGRFRHLVPLQAPLAEQHRKTG